MRERCSPAVDRAIETALTLAAEIGSDCTAGHFLLGLIEESAGRAAALLTQHGVEPGRIPVGLAGLPPSDRLSIDGILAEARTLSCERDGEGTVTSEYFLLALLRCESALERMLVQLGLNRLGLEREIFGDELPLLPMIEPIEIVEIPERIAAGRILDANANRAREALRILDDYCRFALDDAFLTGEIKRLRHDLTELLERLPSSLFLDARETIRDVGTRIGTAREMERDSPREIARINSKRLQEALRSLEEYGKLFGWELAEGLEQLRYRAYTLEKAIVSGGDAREKLAAARLYVLLTAARCSASLDWTIAEAAAGGAGLFQLREKSLDDRALLARARDVRRWTRQAGALFIVNDRPDIARLAEADGVHLGQDDMPVREARQIVGPDALIGVSTHDIEQVRRAVLDGASYIGVGPTFPSTTKSFESFAGLEFAREAFAETSLPAFAIGGINLENLEAVVSAGGRRAAVSAAIAEADDPRLAARMIGEALDRFG